MVEKNTDAERTDAHGLSSRGAWGLGLAFGLAVGVALGAGMDDLLIGLVVGLSIGVAFAMAFGGRLTPSAARKHDAERR